MQKGVEYVPSRLKQKRAKDLSEDSSQGKESKRSTGAWEPSSSDDERSDSEDSMSDLYPRQCIRSLQILFRSRRAEQHFCFEAFVSVGALTSCGMFPQLPCSL